MAGAAVAGTAAPRRRSATLTPLAALLPTPTVATAAGAALVQGTHHLKTLQLQLLPLATQIEGNEMAQMFEGHHPSHGHLEGKGAAAIGPGLLAHLHHQLAILRTGEHQLTAHREVIVTLGQRIRGRVFPRSSGIKGAGLPDTHQLEMEMVLLAAAGINHPEMGGVQVEMTPHQGEQTSQNDCLKFRAVLGAEHTTGQLLGIRRPIVATHHSDGPVLHRLGDRGNGVLAHGVRDVQAGGSRPM